MKLSDEQAQLQSSARALLENRCKAAFVRERGLGGVMYWEQSTDPDERLLDVVRAALFAPASP